MHRVADEEDVRLPCDKFSSSARYSLHYTIRHPAVYITGNIFLLLLLSCFIVNTKHDWYPFLVVLEIFATPAFAISFSVIYNFTYSASRKLSLLPVAGRMKLCAEVIRYHPNASPHTWDIIAKHINDYCFEHYIWPDTNFLYDGATCFRVFERLAFPRNAFGNNTATVQAESRDPNSGRMVSNIVPSPPSAEDIASALQRQTNPEKYIPPSSIDFEMRGILTKAVEVYTESTNTFWRNEYPELSQDRDLQNVQQSDTNVSVSELPPKY